MKTHVVLLGGVIIGIFLGIFLGVLICERASDKKMDQSEQNVMILRGKVIFDNMDIKLGGTRGYLDIYDSIYGCENGIIDGVRIYLNIEGQVKKECQLDEKSGEYLCVLPVTSEVERKTAILEVQDRKWMRQIYTHKEFLVRERFFTVEPGYVVGPVIFYYRPPGLV